MGIVRWWRNHLGSGRAQPHNQLVEFTEWWPEGQQVETLIAYPMLAREENEGGQSNRALLALMQAIEAQIPARQEGHSPIEPALVCFIRTYWGTPHIPPDKVDYVDTYRFVGGVCRDVPASVAERWKSKGIGGFIVPNDANEADIAHATGRDRYTLGSVQGEEENV